MLEVVLPADFPGRSTARAGKPFDFFEVIDSFAADPAAGGANLQGVPVCQGFSCDAQQDGRLCSGHVLSFNFLDHGHLGFSIHLV